MLNKHPWVIFGKWNAQMLRSRPACGFQRFGSWVQALRSGVCEKFFGFLGIYFGRREQISFLANQFENLQFCQNPNQKGGGPNKTHPAYFVAPLAQQAAALAKPERRTAHEICRVCFVRSSAFLVRFLAKPQNFKLIFQKTHLPSSSKIIA